MMNTKTQELINRAVGPHELLMLRVLRDGNKLKEENSKPKTPEVLKEMKGTVEQLVADVKNEQWRGNVGQLKSKLLKKSLTRKLFMS